MPIQTHAKPCTIFILERKEPEKYKKHADKRGRQKDKAEMLE